MTAKKIVFTTSKAKCHEHSHGVAWNANLYADGKLVAKLEQAGWGASDNHDWLDKSPELWDAFVDQATEFNKAHYADDIMSHMKPRTPYNWPDPDYCSMFVQELLIAADFKAQLQRDCRTKICIKSATHSQYEYAVVKVPPTETNIAAVKAKYPEMTILNGSV